MGKRQALTCLAVLAAAAGQPCARAAGTDPSPSSVRNGLVVLNTARRNTDPATIWRYYETWQSDVVPLDGRFAHVDIYDGRKKIDESDGKNARFKIKEARHVLGSPFPPDDWRKAEFDDSGWVRHPGPFPNFYRSLALICLRGKFEVADPMRAGDLTLSVKFQGGAVAYLNGQEVGRSGLPAGKIADATLADTYSHETFVDAKDSPITTPTEYPGRIIGSSEDVKVSYTLKDQDTVNRFKQRARSLEAKIPHSLMKKGVNVLAIEIHRAPADPILFKALEMSGGNNGNITRCWNRASCEEIVLKATAGASGIHPNTDRPDDIQVWTESALARLGGTRYGDPTEPLQGIHLVGLRNGSYAGQVVVGSRKGIKGLSATASDLKLGSAVISASALQVSFPGIDVDALNLSPHLARTPAAEAAGVVQPIWVTVEVPRDAPAGTFKGALTVRVDGEKPVAVPIELKVVGNWALPDPQNFTTFMGVHESADSVAMQYNVPLWSDAHWKHLDKIYELLGQIGTKDVYLTAVAKTHLANEQSMVRWVRQPDGTYKHDFSIMERYLDTALKHLGKAPVVCLYLHDYGFRIESSKMPAVVPCVTVVDSKTGALSEMAPPEWGTPQARAFWTPVVQQTREILAKRGLQKSLMFGMAANNWVKAECCQDMKAIAPDILWVNRTHYFTPTVGDAKVTQPVGLASVVGGVISLFYDPEEEDGQHYGWRSAGMIINYPRMGNVPGAVFASYLPTYRIFGESALLSGGARWRSVKLCRGVGHIGADFWPVLKDPRGGMKNMGDRYVFWHSLSISQVIPSILGAGPSGPVSTTRHQMMREALQEAEARIFVQNALLEPSHAARLGPALAKRCKELCDERTEVLRYYSQFCEPGVLDDYAKVFDAQRWQDMSEGLYQAAGDVAKALGKN